MRRAERPPRDQRPLGRQHARDGVDPHHLERLARLERRQDPRQPPAEHRLARTRRAGEQQVVSSGSRELERPARPLLAADVREVRRLRLGDLVGRLCRRRLSSPRRYATASRRCRTGIASTPPSSASQADSGAQRIRSSPERRAPSATANAPRDGPHTPVERELADSRMLGQARGGHLQRGRQHREGDREVEPGAFLAQAGGREVDRDPLQRPLELRGADPAANAVLRLGAGAVGEPDDRKAGQAAVDVRLDLDPPRLETDEGVSDGAREHSA